MGAILLILLSILVPLYKGGKDYWPGYLFATKASGFIILAIAALTMSFIAADGDGKAVYLNICSFQGHCYCRRRPIALFDDYCGSRPPLLRIKATGC